MEPVTKEMFDDWCTSPVTKRFFNTLRLEKETMKDGLIYDNYEFPEAVKGTCRAIDKILNVEYEDLDGTTNQ